MFPRYVPPEQAKVVASVHASISGSSNSSTSSTPEVRPLKSLLGESAPSLYLNKNTPPNQVRGCCLYTIVKNYYSDHTLRFNTVPKKCLLIILLQKILIKLKKALGGGGVTTYL